MAANIERLQCPSCGATLTPEGRDTLFCSYCGAKLRVKTGASGNPMAVLDEIKEDTSLTAKQAAYAHLERERDELLAHRQECYQAWKAIKEEEELHWLPGDAGRVPSPWPARRSGADALRPLPGPRELATSA